MTFRNGLASLLRPEDSVLVLIDHQPYQLTNLNSHDPHMVVNNATALAKTAKAFGVPTILTSVIADRGGLIFPQITDVFPGQAVIDRTFINTWEDKKVVDAVTATGRKQLIIAGLWTEICVAMPAIQAAGEGWDVTVVTDASGGVSVEAHEVAIQRMIAGGVNMMTWLAVASEWQRDWARTEHAAELTEVLVQHVAGSGIAFLWEQQLLNTPVPKVAVDVNCYLPIPRSCARDGQRLSFCCHTRPCCTSAADATWSSRGKTMCSHAPRIPVQVADLHSRASARALVQQVQASWLHSCSDVA